MSRPIMSEETRLRRRELRQRPEMIELARKYGLLVTEDNEWKVVSHRSRRNESRDTLPQKKDTDSRL